MILASIPSGRLTLNRPDGIDALQYNLFASAMTHTDLSQQTKPNTADLILDAAERIVAREGSGKLTIDAVVRESGFSKGGVLYNFPSKLALIEGMVARVIEATRSRHEQALARAEKEGQNPLLAVFDALINKPEKANDDKVSMGLLAALAEHPELIDPVRQTLARIRADILAVAPDPQIALIVLLAADGLHFSDILGLDILTREERGAVQDRLLSLVSESPQ